MHKCMLYAPRLDFEFWEDCLFRPLEVSREVRPMPPRPEIRVGISPLAFNKLKRRSRSQECQDQNRLI